MQVKKVFEQPKGSGYTKPVVMKNHFSKILKIGFCSLVFASFIFSSVTSLALHDKDLIFTESLRQLGIEADPITIVDKESGIVTKGYEFRFIGKIIDPSAKGLVMMHGWHSNPSEFVHYIQFALRSGFRPHAFSWAGHGWGTENEALGSGNRSWVKGAAPEDYSFDIKINQAQIISDFMIKRTKVFVSIGHSMGAMMTAAANAMGKWKAQLMVQIGGPAHFEFISPFLKPLAWLLVLRNSVSFLRSNEPLENIIGSVEDQSKPLSRERWEILRFIAKNWNVGIALGVSPSYVGTETEFFKAFTEGYRFQGMKFKSPAMFVTGSLEEKFQIKGILEDAEIRGAKAGYITARQQGADHFSQVLNYGIAKNTWELMDRFFKEFQPSHSGSHYEITQSGYRLTQINKMSIKGTEKLSALEFQSSSCQRVFNGL